MDRKAIKLKYRSAERFAKDYELLKKGLSQRLKKPSSSPHTGILSAAIATLGKIGTPQSTAFLKKIAGSKTAQAEAARRAMQSIHSRYARQQQPGTPSMF